MDKNQESSGDELSFLPELAPSAGLVAAPWKVMIVDDEPGVHASTRLALQGIEFRDRGLEFIDAFSGQEALELLRLNEDVAVIFLDVVMETDDAGLRLARQIREEGFRLARIVLRTGHPGYAPEREVVVSYDIHDYKEKSTLDFSKLFTCLISALRAHDDLVSIENHRRGLVSVLEAVSWFDLRSLRRYLARMLGELSSLADIELADLLLAAVRPDRAGKKSAGDFEVLVDGLSTPLNTDERKLIGTTLVSAKKQDGSAGATVYFNASGIDLVLYTRDRTALGNADLVLLELFLNKVAQTLDNHMTFAEILRERDSLIRSFANQHDNWGGHDQRELETMQALSRDTAARLQEHLEFPSLIDDWFVFSIGTAAAFHDLGLQAMPHRLFEKPGPLTDDERSLLNRHTGEGVELLRGNLGELKDSRLFRMAEEVIRQHHERHDGSGYPAGLQGEEISLAARIVGIADTFVAMTSPRAHRPPHSRDEALDYLHTGRGRLFDSRVVDAFLETLNSVN